MRSRTYRSPITYNDIQAMTKHKKNSKELIVDISPLDGIESNEDYCDLSVSIISDDPQENHTQKNDLILTIQKSLAELKNEANLYVNSGDKAIQETNKKLKESVVSVESAHPDQETASILHELKQSIRLLNERLEKNEELFSTKKLENHELQDIVTSLESRVK